ncbi:hypothetical protein D3C85_258320 [compost metagenome]
MPKPNESLTLKLSRARESVIRYFRPSFNQHGLTEQQWRVIFGTSRVHNQSSDRGKQLSDNAQTGLSKLEFSPTTPHVVLVSYDQMRRWPGDSRCSIRGEHANITSILDLTELGGQVKSVQLVSPGWLNGTGDLRMEMLLEVAQSQDGTSLRYTPQDG